MKRRALILASFFLGVAEAFALEGTVLLPDGTPAAGSQVSIVGTSGSVRTDREGKFVIAAPAVAPYILVVVGIHGEIYPPITIERAVERIEVRLEPILSESVHVTGIAPNVESLPASANSLISEKDLEERRPQHLVDAVSQIAGVQVRGEGAAAVPVIRGLAGGRTLILLDDTRVTAERRAGPSATFLDPFSLAAIEVTRGPGSVAYGSDAIGGVIHARPRDPNPGGSSQMFSVSSSFGGQRARSAGIELTHGIGSGAVLLVLHGRDGDDSRAPDRERIPNSSFRDHGVALRFLQPTPSGIFRAALSMNRAGDVGAPSADAATNPTVYPEEESRRVTISLDAVPWYGFHDIEVRLSAASYDITTTRGVSNPSSSTVTANDVALRMAASRLLGRGRLRGGFDYNGRLDLHATSPNEVSIDDARKTDTGAFFMTDWHVSGPLMISAGARTDRANVRNRGGFFGDRSRRDTAYSGFAAVSFTPVAEITATLQAARGYRDPTLSDRYFRGVSGRGFVTGNPDLEAESSRQFDTAVRWHRGQRSLSLFGYLYRIRGLVERYRAGRDFRFRNRGEAEVRGLELEGSMPLPYKFSLHAAAAIARGEVLDDAAPLDDIAMPNAHIALRWNHNRIAAFANAFLFGKDHRPGPVEVNRPGYTNLDLGFSYRLSRQLFVRVVGKNMTDVRHAGSADANAALAPGRSISIAIDGSFRRKSPAR